MFKNTRVLPPPPIISSSVRTAESFRLETAPGVKSNLHRPELLDVQFGWVVVINPDLVRVDGYRRVETCCVGCGTVRWTSFDNLRRGLSKGCQPCSQPILTPKWLQKRMEAARGRCQNPEDVAFKHYGGRGVEFRFRSATDAALWVVANLGLHKALEIDRINNAGHYEAGNLRWATRSLQMRNTRRTKVPIKRTWLSPYADFTTARLEREGLSREQIIDRAHDAVRETRKNWRTIAERLQSMTS